MPQMKQFKIASKNTLTKQNKFDAIIRFTSEIQSCELPGWTLKCDTWVGPYARNLTCDPRVGFLGETFVEDIKV